MIHPLKLNTRLLLSRITKFISAILLAYFLITAVTLTYTRFFDHDEFQHIHIAWSMRHGASLYSQDLSDQHNIGFSLTNIGIWNFLHLPETFNTLFVFRTVSLMCLGLILWLVYKIACTIFNKSVAQIACLILIANMTFINKVIEIRPDVIMNTLLLWSAYFVYTKKPTGTTLVDIGVLWGFALLFHFKALLFIIPYIIILLFIARTPDTKKSSFTKLFALITILIFCFGLLFAFKILLVKFSSVSLLGFLRYTVFYYFKLWASSWRPYKWHPFSQSIPWSNLFFIGLGWAAPLIYILKEKINQKKTIFLTISALLSSLLYFGLYRQWFMLFIPAFSINIAVTLHYLWQKKEPLSKILSAILLAILMTAALFESATLWKVDIIPRSYLPQKRLTDAVLQETDPAQKIFFFWSNMGGYMFRPHALAQWKQNLAKMQRDITYKNISIPTLQKNPDFAVLYDKSEYSPEPPDLQLFLERNYRQSKQDHRLWLKK